MHWIRKPVSQITIFGEAAYESSVSVLMLCYIGSRMASGERWGIFGRKNKLDE